MVCRPKWSLENLQRITQKNNLPFKYDLLFNDGKYIFLTVSFHVLNEQSFHRSHQISNVGLWIFVSWRHWMLFDCCTGIMKHEKSTRVCFCWVLFDNRWCWLFFGGVNIFYFCTSNVNFTFYIEYKHLIEMGLMLFEEKVRTREDL
jgi:hypothetical protein